MQSGQSALRGKRMRAWGWLTIWTRWGALTWRRQSGAGPGVFRRRTCHRARDGDPWTECAYCLGLGLITLADGRPHEACGLLREAEELGGAVGSLAEQATALAGWSGPAGARRHRSGPAAHGEGGCVPGRSRRYIRRIPRQEVWWWRYRALASSSEGIASGVALLPDAAGTPWIERAL